jgi:hypothetical protein
MANPASESISEPIQVPTIPTRMLVMRPWRQPMILPAIQPARPPLTMSDRKWMCGVPKSLTGSFLEADVQLCIERRAAVGIAQRQRLLIADRARDRSARLPCTRYAGLRPLVTAKWFGRWRRNA